MAFNWLIYMALWPKRDRLLGPALPQRQGTELQNLYFQLGSNALQNDFTVFKFQTRFLRKIKNKNKNKKPNTSKLECCFAQFVRNTCSEDTHSSVDTCHTETCREPDSPPGGRSAEQTSGFMLEHGTHHWNPPRFSVNENRRAKQLSQRWALSLGRPARQAGVRAAAHGRSGLEPTQGHAVVPSLWAARPSSPSPGGLTLSG